LIFYTTDFFNVDENLLNSRSQILAIRTKSGASLGNHAGFFFLNEQIHFDLESFA